MSKSLGNVVAPQEVTEQSGAEILGRGIRLFRRPEDWAGNFKHQIDAHRRLRNTLRYLIGNLTMSAHAVPVVEMPELERWVLHRLWQLDVHVRQCCETFDFHGLFRELYNFCTIDLSAFYFDIRKDCLCDPTISDATSGTDSLGGTIRLLDSVAGANFCFTAEEAWLQRNPGETESSPQDFP